MWLIAIPDQDTQLGQSLNQRIYDDAQNALHITDVPYGTSAETGTKCTDENVNNALAIVSGMTTDLANQVKTVSATDAESTKLTLESGVEIAFGPAQSIREKERVCLQILNDNPGKGRLHQCARGRSPDVAVPVKLPNKWHFHGLGRRPRPAQFAIEVSSCTITQVKLHPQWETQHFNRSRCGGYNAKTQ